MDRSHPPDTEETPEPVVPVDISHWRNASSLSPRDRETVGRVVAEVRKKRAEDSAGSG